MYLQTSILNRIEPRAVIRTLHVFRLELLTACLVLKLVILTDEAVTVRALEDSSSVVPNSSVTLDAGGISERTGTGMGGETFTTVTDPSLAEIANGTLEGDEEVERKIRGGEGEARKSQRRLVTILVECGLDLSCANYSLSDSAVYGLGMQGIYYL